MPLIIIGTLLTVTGIACGIGTGLIVKIIAEDVSLLMTLWFRFALSLPLLFCAAYWQQGASAYKIKAKGTLCIRILLGLAGISLWFISMRTLPIGLATALVLSSTIYVAMASPFFLQERVGIYRWSAVLVGLLGVFIIADIFSASFNAAIIFPILASMASAGLQITLRKLGRSDAPASVASWYNFAGFMVMTALLFLMPDRVETPPSHIWPYLIALGVIGAGLQLSFTASYHYIDAVIVSTLRYLQVPLAMLLGFFMFSEIPTIAQAIGIAMIVSASIVIVIREFMRKAIKSKEQLLMVEKRAKPRYE